MFADKGKSIAPTDLIGEFEPIGLFDEAFKDTDKVEHEPNETDKEWIKWCEDNGLSYSFEDGKLVIDPQQKGR